MDSPVSVKENFDIAMCPSDSKTESTPQRSLGRSVSFRRRLSILDLRAELSKQQLSELEDMTFEPLLPQKRSETLPDLDDTSVSFLFPKRCVARSSSFRSAAELASKCRDVVEPAISEDRRPSTQELDTTSTGRRRARSRTRRGNSSRRDSRSKSRSSRSRSKSQTRVAATVGVALLTVGDTTAFIGEAPTRGVFTRSASDSSILSEARESLALQKPTKPAFGMPSRGSAAQSSTSLNCFKALGAVSHMAATMNSSSGSFNNPAEMLGNLDAREVLSDLETRQILGDVDASILGDLSCLAEDLPGVLQKGDLAIKIGGLASQVLALTADLLPGHDVSMDSLAYQLLMVASASNAVFQTVHPMIQAAMRENGQDSITIHDQRTFEDLFSPAGVTMSQFQDLSDSAMEWIEVEPGEAVPSDEGQDDEHFYYMYSGEVEVERGGELLYRVERGEPQKLDSAAASRGLIGEETLIRSLSKGFGQEQSSDAMTIKAGDTGAKMLRIEKSKLDNMMNQDKDLCRSMGILVMQSMQAKMKVERRPVPGV